MGQNSTFGTAGTAMGGAAHGTEAPLHTAGRQAGRQATLHAGGRQTAKIAPASRERLAGAGWDGDGVLADVG
jgi:hypothetical protein